MNSMVVRTFAITFCMVILLFLVLHNFTTLRIIKSERSRTWALLVAGSRGWDNYRHQADVCHAYQVLHNHGVPKENIIVMMYDDIANNSKNPKPGEIYNYPGGPNVYKGITVGDISPVFTRKYI